MERVLFIPNISRVRDVHWQGFRGAAVLLLPQAPDNAANGHLGLARRVKIFLLSWKSVQVTKGYLKKYHELFFYYRIVA